MFDYWYEPDPPIMIGSAHSVSGDGLETVKRPIGFVWPNPMIAEPTSSDIIKYGQPDA